MAIGTEFKEVNIQLDNKYKHHRTSFKFKMTDTYLLRNRRTINKRCFICRKKTNTAIFRLINLYLLSCESGYLPIYIHR